MYEQETQLSCHYKRPIYEWNQHLEHRKRICFPNLFIKPCLNSWVFRYHESLNCFSNLEFIFEPCILPPETPFLQITTQVRLPSDLYLSHFSTLRPSLATFVKISTSPSPQVLLTPLSYLMFFFVLITNMLQFLLIFLIICLLTRM